MKKNIITIAVLFILCSFIKLNAQTCTQIGGYTVPVVINSNSGSTTIQDAYNCIDLLNAEFSGVNSSNTNAVNTGIQFCLVEFRSGFNPPHNTHSGGLGYCNYLQFNDPYSIFWTNYFEPRPYALNIYSNVPGPTGLGGKGGRILPSAANPNISSWNHPRIPIVFASISGGSLIHEVGHAFGLCHDQTYPQNPGCGWGGFGQGCQYITGSSNNPNQDNSSDEILDTDNTTNTHMGNGGDHFTVCQANRMKALISGMKCYRGASGNPYTGTCAAASVSCQPLWATSFSATVIGTNPYTGGNTYADPFGNLNYCTSNLRDDVEISLTGEATTIYDGHYIIGYDNGCTQVTGIIPSQTGGVGFQVNDICHSKNHKYEIYVRCNLAGNYFKYTGSFDTDIDLGYQKKCFGVAFDDDYNGTKHHGPPNLGDVINMGKSGKRNNPIIEIVSQKEFEETRGIVKASYEKTTDLKVIYPNPSNEIINFNFGYLSPDKIEIISIHGKVVSKIESGDFEDVWNPTINVKNFAPGLYIARLTKNGNVLYVEKFVKE